MIVKFLTVLVVFPLLFFSCGQKQEQTYRKYSSFDNTYSIEIPSNASQKKCFTDFMGFEDPKSHLFIIIQHINEETLEEFVRNNNITIKTFSHHLFQSSDTTYFYKITKGNNMWSAYDLYMLKRLEGKKYVVQVSSDVFRKSNMIEMIKHIYSSMKSNKVGETNVMSNKKYVQSIPLEKTYSTRFYSIKYPKGWQKQEHLDEMTEVYIGYQPDIFGFTIVRFETNYTLSEINRTGNENICQAGFRILDEKQMKVDGVKCYRAVQEISIQGQKVKHISYTFKKGEMLYNIKFGSVTTKAQETLAAEITKSFRFK